VPGPGQPEQVEERLLLRGRRGRSVLVQQAGLRLRDVGADDSADQDLLPATWRAGDLDDVACLDLPMGLGGLAVESDLAALAGLLSFRARSEETGDVEPDVETQPIRILLHGTPNPLYTIAVPRQGETGFSLLELLVVVALLLIIAAFAAPRLLRARVSANEASAIASLRAVGVSQDLYARFCGSGGYADSLVVLGATPPGGSGPFLSPDLTSSASPQKAGYTFVLAAGAGASDGVSDCHGNTTKTAFYAKAEPVTLGISGRRSFAIATNHTMWQTVGATAPTEPFGAPSEPVP
jgi:type IV pilus assembly protein PilA